MELSIVLPLLLFILIVQVITIYMAKLLGRNTRLWFWASLLLPIISWIILICLPVKTKVIPSEQQQKIYTRIENKYSHDTCISTKTR